MGAKELNLFDSIKNGDVNQAVKIIVKNSSSIKKSSDSSNLKGNQTYFQTLKSKINVNFQNESGMTCLHQAAINGNLELVKLLVECGAQVDIKDSNGYSPLHYSVQFNKTELVALFLQFGINPNDPTLKNDTPLHLAVQYAHSEKIIINLLNNGAYFSLASQNQFNLTPFELACDLGKTKIIDSLLKACTGSNSDYLDLIKKYSTKCLNLAAKNGHDDIIRLILINNIIDINYSTPEGTALHEACRYGRLQTVKLLLESGIDSSLNNSNSQLAQDVIIKQKIGNDIKCLIKEYSQSVKALSIKPNKSTHTGSLNFNQNELITVLDKSNYNWRGFILDKASYTTRSGYFPAECVQLIEENIFQVKKSYITSSTNSLLKLNDSDTQSLTEQSIYLSNTNLDKISKCHKNVSPSSSSSLSSSSSSSYNKKNFEESNSIYLKSPVSFKSGVKNVAYLLKMGLSDSQIIFNWLKEFNMEGYYENFVKSGYDLITITKCCPADLCAIGVSDPGDRQLIKKAISNLDISEIENRLDQYLTRISSLDDLLRLIHLEQYLPCLNELYTNFNDYLNTVSWEDLEDLGIKKLGHQKKLIFISKRIKQLRSTRLDNQVKNDSTSLHQLNNLTKSLENLDFKNKIKVQPPLPPRVSSIFVPKDTSYATLPRNFIKKKEDRSESSSSSSTSPNSISPNNKYFDVNSILVPPTPPPMALISIPLDESISRKSPRRPIKINPDINESYQKINSNLKLNSVLNRSRDISHVNSRFNNSSQKLSLPFSNNSNNNTANEDGILNDIDSMLCDLNKQLDNMLDYERSFNT